MNKTCLILGGSGFIGSSVCDQLLADGWSLRVFDRPGVAPYRPFSLAESVAWIEGDFQNTSDVRQAVSGVDAVVHLISTTLPKDSNEFPAKDIQGNVVATLGLLDAMVTCNVKRIVFASSGGTVYGRPQTLPITEQHPTQPEVSYGISKLTIEKYLYLYSRLHGIEPVSLRIANPYGDRQRIETAQGAVAAFLHRALHQLPVDIWGDGSVTRDYLHVSDVAKAFSLALLYRGPEIIFNISSGTGTSLNELLAAIESLTSRVLKKNYLPGRAFDVPASVLSNTLAAKELGWSPTISLREGLRRTLATKVG